MNSDTKPAPSRSRDAAAPSHEHNSAEAATAAAEQLRLFVECVKDYAIFLMDTQGHITTWNSGAESILGYSEADVLGQHASLIFTPEDIRSGQPEKERQTAVAQGRAEDERWHLRKDGSRFFASGVLSALRDEAGNLMGFGKILRDLTAQRQAQRALKESDERFRLLVKETQDYAIFMLDPQGRILTWNMGAERLTGYTEAEVIGESIAMFFTEEDRQRGKPEQEISTAAQQGRSEDESWRVRKDGSRFWANEILNALYNDEGVVLWGFAKIIRDLSERRRAEEALTQANERLEERVAERTRKLQRVSEQRQELLRQMASVQEEERRRISRELHDQTGQHLTALSLGLKALEDETVSTCPPDSGAPLLIERMREVAQDLARDVHRIAVELRPPALDDLGLEPALDNYIAQWSERSGIPAELEATGLEGPRRLPSLVETSVYRVVQEALNNVSRHAAETATRVSVTLQRFDANLLAVIEDNGAGFDVEKAAQSRRLGLSGMRERAASCGGALEVESTPGEGTSVFLRVPLQEE